MARLRIAAALLVAMLLADCAGGAMPGLLGQPAGLPAGMAGRWLLSAPNAPMCGLNFSEGDGRSGRVSPEGGCPANFYLSRRWALEGSGLTIRDDNGDTLGQMILAGERFDGQSATGVPISLTHPILPPTE
jgi:hypothetical protein